MGVGQHRHTGKLKPDTAESHGIPLPTTIIIDDGTLDMWCIDPHTWSHCDILKEKMDDHQRQEQQQQQQKQHRQLRALGFRRKLRGRRMIVSCGVNVPIILH